MCYNPYYLARCLKYFSSTFKMWRETFEFITWHVWNACFIAKRESFRRYSLSNASIYSVLYLHRGLQLRYVPQRWSNRRQNIFERNFNMMIKSRNFSTHHFFPSSIGVCKLAVLEFLPRDYQKIFVFFLWGKTMFTLY